MHWYLSKDSICIFMIISEVKYYFICLWAIQASSSVIFFFLSSAYFSTGFSFLNFFIHFFLICWYFKNRIFWIQVLCYMYCKYLLLCSLIFFLTFIFVCVRVTPSHSHTLTFLLMNYHTHTEKNTNHKSIAR